MKKKKVRLIIICIVAALVAASLITGICTGNYAASEAMTMNCDTTSKNSKQFLEKIGFSEDDFISKWSSSSERITYHSKKGNDLPINYICTQKNKYNNPTMILIHSLGFDYSVMYPLADSFLDKGYNVVMYDQRAHGNNNAETVTYGQLETAELESVVEYIQMCTDETCTIALLGQGTGADTAIHYASESANSKNIDFVILEDPYSNASDAVNSLVKQNSGIIPEELYISLRDKCMQSKYNFDVKSADFRVMASGISVPALVLNHKNSEKCSFTTSNNIYESVPGDKKTLVTFENSDYMTSFTDENEKYIQSVEEFIEKFMS
ncbi:MAG: DUF1749 domain-containing protein [Oscillospiraceae bacterium]|nr:DUF1749 domain-containing protein [Oscillospiraceae bacterium]